MERRSLDSYMRQRPKSAVLEAGQVSVVDFTECGGSITGRVTTRRGKPIPEAKVHVKSLADWREPGYLLSVNGEGVFRIGGVPPGPYDVRVELPGRSSDLPDEARRKVEVGSGEVICDLLLDSSIPICVVTGRVVDRVTGKPALGAKVQLRERGKGYSVCGELRMPDSEWLPYGEAAMGSEESFRIEVFSPGSYLLTASTGPPEARLVGWLDPLELGPSEGHVEVTIPVGGSSSLAIAVLDARSRTPTAGSSVDLHPAQGVPIELQAKADASGKAVLRNLPPGRYRLEVRSEGHATHRETLELPEAALSREVLLGLTSSIAVSIEGALKETSEYYVTAVAVSGDDPGWEYTSKDGAHPATCGAFEPGRSRDAIVRLRARPGRYGILFSVVEVGSSLSSIRQETQEVEVPEEGGEVPVRLTLGQ